MHVRSVGATGLKVSRLGLGTMTWGRDTDEHGNAVPGPQPPTPIGAYLGMGDENDTNNF